MSIWRSKSQRIRRACQAALDGNDDHTSNCNKLKRQIEELCMQIKLASLQRPRSQREEAARVLAENMLSEAH
jgi:hypothetical protein